MIATEAELYQSIEQLDRMYRALAAIRFRLAPKDTAQFQVLAEGPIDEIRRLRSEIDAYLGVRSDEAVPA